MSYELTPDRLQSLAISCVTQFITKQASLSEAIAKEAQELELNSDQTKRVIEASNTLAYLRQLEKAADRTFEFEVAEYDKVMAHMCMPDDMLKAAGTPPWLNKDKTEDEDKDGASTKSEKSDEKKEDKSESKDDKKESKDEKDEGDEDRSGEDDESKEQEKKAMLAKGYFQSKARLEKIAYDKLDLHLQLSAAADKLHRDPHGFEKLSEVVKGEDLTKVCRLCGIEKSAGEDLIFRDKELIQARAVVDLLKMAQAMIEEEQKLQDFVKRAEVILFHKTANVEKLAGFGGLMTRAISGVAEGAGRAINWSARKTGQMAYNAGKTIGKPSGFMQNAKVKGFPEKDHAIKMFDRMKKEKGATAATQYFGGHSPSLLKDRVGPANIGFGVLTAAGLTHTVNAKDLNK